MKKAMLSIVILYSILHTSFAQLSPEVISSSFGLYTPETLVQNTILGNGITITNITYTGDEQSLGSFNYFNSEIGINEGIILSTGKVTDAAGIGCNDASPCSITGNTGTASTNTIGGSDADLTLLSNGSFLYDAAILVIEFIPDGDSLSLSYIFASEEYQSYTCASFNDVMGIFLSGPGISGPYSNNGVNIALVPGSNIPVSINSVNGGIATGSSDPNNCISLDNSQYFIDNISAGFNIEYSGFTTPLHSGITIIPGASYTLRIAIADASDSILDSSLFLELESFSSNVISTDISYSNPFGYLAEGCGSMDIVLSIGEALDTNLTIPFSIIGDATLGTDFIMTPNTINFPAGSTSTVISINALEDTEIEGFEGFEIAMQVEGEIEYIPISISDSFIDIYNYGDQVLACNSDSVLLNLDSVPNLGNSLQTFSSDTTFEITADTIHYIDINVSGISQPTINENMAISVCMNIGNSSFIYEAAIWLISPDNKIISLASFNAPAFIPGGGYMNTCFSSTAFQSITEGTVPFTGNWLPEGNLGNLLNSPTNGTWRLAVMDIAPGFAPTFFDWSITFNNSFYEVEYFWSPQAGLDCSTCPEPLAVVSDMTYYVTITDSYGCIKEDSVTVTITNGLDPVVIDSVNVLDEDCNGGPGSIELFLSGSVDEIEWNTGQDTSFIDNLSAGTYSVTVENGCGQDTIASYIIEPGLDFELNTVAAPCGGTGSASIISDEVYTISWSNGSTGPSTSGLELGNYTVFVSNANCNSSETFDIISDSDCSVNVTGHVKLELGDDDCSYDALTVPSQFRILSLSDNNETQYAFTDLNGAFSFDDVSTGNHDLILENFGYNNILNCPTSTTIPLNVMQTGSDYNNNDYWLIKANSQADLQVSLSNHGIPRPDFNNIAKIYCRNIGGGVAEGNTVVFTHAPEQTFINVASNVAVTHTYDITTSTVTITLPDMQPNEIVNIDVDLYIPITANIGDTYVYSTSISSTSSEIDLNNNFANTQFDIINSYDPNNKQVLPNGIGENGNIAPEQEELTFTINFQNEGTANAINVILKDEIDIDVFDLTSIRFLESSHPFVPSIEGNSILVITYDNINLVPESISEEGSKGFIIFAIDLKENLPLGTEIKNGADIFFDFNDAIVTNETLNTITDFTSNNDIPNLDFNIIPNPAKDKLQLSSKEEIINVYIIDRLGKEVLEINDYSRDQDLDIKSLAQGIYFVQVKTKNGSKGVKKLIIIR